VVVELRPGGSSAAVTAWLEARGLATMGTIAGVLASGDADAVTRAFGPDMRVPAELAEHVGAVLVVPPKQFHD
jgi:hypothetical protein